MSDLVKKCVLRVEVNNAEEEGATALNQNASRRRGRQSRPIRVETFASRLEPTSDNWRLLPVEASQDESSEANRKFVGEADPGTEIGFFSGNPFVEVTKGILHLYKEDVLSDREGALTLCLLGVPTSMTCHDLLAFTAPCHAEIAHIRVLRDAQPNSYMALLEFRTHSHALEFYLTFNGAPYSSLEPDALCWIVWVSRIEWDNHGLPPIGHTELPVCPVCLERMDESVDGVLTILCNHAFHANCLEQWSDSTCPVCRCVQSPETAETSECERCESSSPDALWICLICGHVGCGRYQGGHAASHYRESGHSFALQLGSHRVWDYKGDNFVHRLLQNKGDGKLVPAEAPPTPAEHAQEKLDSVQLEFTHLLTSQLEEQRAYFEDKLAVQASELSSLRDDNHSLTNQQTSLTSRLANSNKDKAALEKKVAQLQSRLTSVQSELGEERQLGKALRANQSQYQNQIAQLERRVKDLEASKEAELGELKEQVRDLMFFVEAQQMIGQSALGAELAGGTVGVAPAPQSTSKPRKNKRK